MQKNGDFFRKIVAGDLVPAIVRGDHEGHKGRPQGASRCVNCLVKGDPQGHKGQPRGAPLRIS